MPNIVHRMSHDWMPHALHLFMLVLKPDSNSKLSIVIRIATAAAVAVAVVAVAVIIIVDVVDIGMTVGTTAKLTRCC